MCLCARLNASTSTNSVSFPLSDPLDVFVDFSLLHKPSTVDLHIPRINTSEFNVFIHTTHDSATCEYILLAVDLMRMNAKCGKWALFRGHCTLWLCLCVCVCANGVILIPNHSTYSLTHKVVALCSFAESDSWWFIVINEFGCGCGKKKMEDFKLPIRKSGSFCQFVRILLLRPGTPRLIWDNNNYYGTQRCSNKYVRNYDLHFPLVMMRRHQYGTY